MANPERQSKPPTHKSEQKIQNWSFDEEYNVMAIELLGEYGSSLKRVQVNSNGELIVDNEGTATTPADGRKTVASAGTAEALDSDTACKWVMITAETDNTNPVVVGASTVVASQSTRRGTPLYPGDTAIIPCDNLNQVYVDVVTSGEGVTFTYAA